MSGKIQMLLKIMTYFLDAVVTEFLTKIEDIRDNGTIEGKEAFFYLEKAYNFAKRQRALGLGVLGWHSLLQSKGLAFDTKESAKLNVEVFKLIKEKSYKASEELAKNLVNLNILKVMVEEMLHLMRLHQQHHQRLF